MKFLSVITPLVALFSVASAVDIRYDTVYDNPQGSLSTVACSNGANGLQTKGYTTFSSIPTFPNIGGAQAVTGWNSSACGSCWQITVGAVSINFTAIDHADDGFVVSLEAFNTLTDGNGVEVGFIGDAQATQIGEQYCGL
ncbi:Cerato-platanin [Lactarius quietus]|nr:Cerato-platanin [Lactarius quietus]